MYAVSNTWAKAQENFLAPEGLIEISCYIPALKRTLVYTKRDLLSFTHQQTGSLVSGELPKNHIEFSLDNSDGKWNPHNPDGMGKYLSERLKVFVRYGFKIDGVEEWIPGGTFYLSEWSTTQNGLEASFKARDLLEYMIDKSYTGEIAGRTLSGLALAAFNEADLPDELYVSAMVLGDSQLGVSSLSMPLAIFDISNELNGFTVGEIENTDEDSIAVIFQKCANAARCVLYQDRGGTFRIRKLNYADSKYTIPKKLSYSYPEISLKRPLKNVSVTYYGDAVKLYNVGDSGEVQTLNNDFIRTEAQATDSARWICDSLRHRQQITGEFRGDPRFDLFDVVNIESKYGTIKGVVLTDIKISFNGAFRVSYSGYVRGLGVPAVIRCGEILTGEVV